MFSKLKAKLSSFRDKIGSKIDEKAIEVEVSSPDHAPAEPSAAHVPVDEKTSSLDKKATPKSVGHGPAPVAHVQHPTTGQKHTPVAPTTHASEVTHEKAKKTSFFQKAKAFVIEREFILDEDDLEEPLWDLQMSLMESDIALSVAEAITGSVRDQLTGTRRRIGKDTGEIVEKALRKAILDVMSANVFDFDDYVRDAQKPVHIVFAGINGTGKTTSIAKLAKRLTDQGYSVVLAAGDTFRAGAIDQIAIHGKKLGVKVIKHQEQGDPAAVVYDAMQHARANKADVVLSDTAGRMHTNINLMEQLKKICRVSPPDLLIFVDEAVAGNDAVERAALFNAAVPLSGSILTKTDADAKGGAAISIAYITGKPIIFLGMGQGYDDLQKFDPVWFVDQLFEQ